MKKLICIMILALILLAPTAFAKGCKHENTELRDASAGSCESRGYTGDLCCVDCDAVLISGVYTTNGVHVLDTTPEGYRASTCVQKGFSGNYYCSECSALIIHGEVLPLTEHVPGGSREMEEPSCRTEGITAKTYCTVCYEDISGGEAIPALGHDFTEGFEKIEPTCRTEGLLTGYCARCDWDIEDEIPVTEHQYEDNVCTGCGYRMPGLYDTDGTLLKTWDELCADGDIYYKKYRDYDGYRIDYQSVYQGMTGMLVIPDDADFYPEMLAGTHLSSIWLGKSVRNLYDFCGCPDLESIYIFCDTEVEMEDSDIYDHPNLKEIVIAEGCDFGIGRDAFVGCPNLERIVLPTDLSDSWINSNFVPNDNFTFCYRGTEEQWIEEFGEDYSYNVVFNYTEA